MRHQKGTFRLASDSFYALRSGFKERICLKRSEMAWGAVAHYLKSIAKLRGWRNRSHRDLFRVVNRLSSETDNFNEIQNLFVTMNGLHVNFYEDWLENDAVRVGIEDAKEFVGRLEREFAA